MTRHLAMLIPYIIAITILVFFLSFFCCILVNCGTDCMHSSGRGSKSSSLILFSQVVDLQSKNCKTSVSSVVG